MNKKAAPNIYNLLKTVGKDAIPIGKKIGPGAIIGGGTLAAIPQLFAERDIDPEYSDTMLRKMLNVLGSSEDTVGKVVDKLGIGEDRAKELGLQRLNESSDNNIWESGVLGTLGILGGAGYLRSGTMPRMRRRLAEYANPRLGKEVFSAPNRYLSENIAHDLYYDLAQPMRQMAGRLATNLVDPYNYRQGLNHVFRDRWGLNIEDTSKALSKALKGEGLTKKDKLLGAFNVASDTYKGVDKKTALKDVYKALIRDESAIRSFQQEGFNNNPYMDIPRQVLFRENFDLDPDLKRRLGFIGNTKDYIEKNPNGSFSLKHLGLDDATYNQYAEPLNKLYKDIMASMPYNASAKEKEKAFYEAIRNVNMAKYSPASTHTDGVMGGYWDTLADRLYKTTATDNWDFDLNGINNWKAFRQALVDDRTGFEVDGKALTDPYIVNLLRAISPAFVAPTRQETVVSAVPKSRGIVKNLIKRQEFDRDFSTSQLPAFLAGKYNVTDPKELKDVMNILSPIQKRRMYFDIKRNGVGFEEALRNIKSDSPARSSGDDIIEMLEMLRDESSKVRVRENRFSPDVGGTLFHKNKKGPTLGLPDLKGNGVAKLLNKEVGSYDEAVDLVVDKINDALGTNAKNLDELREVLQVGKDTSLEDIAALL